MKQLCFTLMFSTLLYSLSFAQTGKAILILKDSTRINGIGKISGISSIVTVKFKNDTLKYKSYKSKEIIGIDILENNYYRKFRYKYVKGEKYPEIMEIVSVDSLSLYVRIYDGGAISNSFSNEPVGVINNSPNETVKLDNGQEIKISQSKNMYTFITIPRYSYYVGIGQSDEVEHLYTKGLPFAKSFKKSMKTYFKNCPELIEKVNNKAFSNKDLVSVLEFYNINCFKNNSE